MGGIQNTAYKIDYYGSVLQQFIHCKNNNENTYLQNFFFFALESYKLLYTHDKNNGKKSST